MVSGKSEILTELQEKFLIEFSKYSISEKFYLTGGTALSAFYIKHRYSEDMDFFTSQEGVIMQLKEILEKISTDLNSELYIRRSFETFLECFIKNKKESIMLHFSLDTPFRLENPKKNEYYGIQIDSLIDIACNKFSALFDRYDAKDFVDIYFISREVMDFWKIYEKAKQKHVGIEPYFLTVSLKNVYKIEKLPRMIKPVTIKELQEFYEDKILKLMEKIKKGEI